MQLFGLIWSGPSAHFWQFFTERLFRGKRDGATIIKKTLLDQLSYGPLCNAMYMAYVALVVEGAPPSNGVLPESQPADVGCMRQAGCQGPAWFASAGRSLEFTQQKLWNDFLGVQRNGWRVRRQLPEPACALCAACCSWTCSARLCHAAMRQVWPIVSLVNYRYIPLRLRVLFVNAVALFWCVSCPCDRAIGCMALYQR